MAVAQTKPAQSPYQFLPRAPQAPTVVVTEAPRRRVGASAHAKAALEHAKKLTAAANARAREAKQMAEETIGEARKMDLLWAAGEGVASIGGNVASTGLATAADYMLADDWNSMIAGAQVGAGVLGGIASLVGGLAIHPRIGTVGLALSAGIAAPGVSTFVRRAVVMGLDKAVPSMRAAA
jgi:hypothetical protein